MHQTFISLMRSPGGEDEGGSIDPKNEEVKADDLQADATDKPQEKGFIGKIKEALREWSNDDQKDQDEDDATP
jgi:hypothetical protein